MPQTIGDFEQLILFALIRLGPHAYGVTIRNDIETRTGRTISPGALYTALARLEKRGLVASRLGEPTPERGGRARRCYAATKPAVAALRASQRALLSLWDGVELGAEK